MDHRKGLDDVRMQKAACDLKFAVQAPEVLGREDAIFVHCFQCDNFSCGFVGSSEDDGCGSGGHDRIDGAPSIEAESCISVTLPVRPEIIAEISWNESFLMFESWNLADFFRTEKSRRSLQTGISAQYDGMVRFSGCP
jgi:hypothetical protein